MNKPNRLQMEEFKTLLNQEITLHEEIETKLKDKKTTLVSGDLKQLADLDDQLEKLTERARNLEKERLRQMVVMGREGETLKQFIHTLNSGEDRQFLENARHRLVQTIESIQHQSRANRDLLTQSIHFIEQSVNVIASLLAPEATSYNNRPGRPTRNNTMSIPMQGTSTISRDA